MDTVTVTARETFPYAGITRTAGESFEATVEDARVLTLIGRVDRVPSSDSAPGVDLAKHDDDASATTPRRNRTYQRKNLTAEPPGA